MRFNAISLFNGVFGVGGRGKNYTQALGVKIQKRAINNKTETAVTPMAFKHEPVGWKGQEVKMFVDGVLNCICGQLL